MNAAGHVWRWGALIVLMIIADQLTKWMVLQTPAFNALACLDPVVLCGRIEISSVFDLTMLWNRGVSFGTMAQQPHVPGTAKTYRFSKSSSEFFTCDDLDAFADALDHLDGAADAAGIADDGTV